MTAALKKEPQAAEVFTAAQDIEYSAEFVPFSQSRNASDDNPSLNWRVTLKRNGSQLTCDYMQGCGHIPNYVHQFARLAVYDDAVREACETGKSAIIKRKNGYDSAQAGKIFAPNRKIPEPELVEVLSCLVMDSEVIEYDSFEEWAETFGYSTDSRQAERMYRQCLETALKLRRMIDLDAAREAFQDY